MTRIANLIIDLIVNKNINKGTHHNKKYKNTHYLLKLLKVIKIIFIINLLSNFENLQFFQSFWTDFLFLLP